MSIFGKEGLLIDTLLATPPFGVTLFYEAAYEEDIEKVRAPLEQERQLRNEHLVMAWKNKGPQIEAQSLLCDNKLWKLGDLRPERCLIILFQQRSERARRFQN